MPKGSKDERSMAYKHVMHSAVTYKSSILCKMYNNEWGDGVYFLYIAALPSTFQFFDWLA